MPAGRPQPGRPALTDKTPIPARSADEAFGTADGELLPPQQLLLGRPPRSAGSASGVPPSLAPAGRRFCPLGFATQGRLEHSREPVPSCRAGAGRGEPTAIGERAKVPSVQPDPASAHAHDCPAPYHTHEHRRSGSTGDPADEGTLSGVPHRPGRWPPRTSRRGAH